MLSTRACACGGRGFVYFFRETIGCAGSARWSASAVGMLGVVLPGRLALGEEGGSSAFGWDKKRRWRGMVSPPPETGAAALAARDACGGGASPATGRGDQGTWLPADG